MYSSYTLYTLHTIHTLQYTYSGVVGGKALHSAVLEAHPVEVGGEAGLLLARVGLVVQPVMVVVVVVI